MGRTTGKNKIAKKIAGQAVRHATGKVQGKAMRTAAKHLRGYVLATLILLGAAGIGFSYVPEERIPDALEPVHTFTLRTRNNVIAKIAPDSSRYDDTAVVPIPNSTPVKLYFAPSPHIREGLCKLIDSAQSSVDLCIYDLDLFDVARALTDAEKRGVAVRVVTDTDNFKLQAVNRLKDAKIPVVPDNRPAIMHNKFVIVDAKYVWTGSFNFTINGSRKNDNNALILESPQLAACYQTKFEEYFSGKFGPKARRKTNGGKVVIGGTMPVEVMFSPSDGVQKRLLEELAKAKHSVRMMAFSFTAPEVAKELTSLAKRGVSVRCLFDNGQAHGEYSQNKFLGRNGVAVRLAPNRSGKMHHKVIIIDDETVITGSYNFSRNAERSNDENILIIKNKEIAREFNREFRRCWRGTKGYL